MRSSIVGLVTALLFAILLGAQPPQDFTGSWMLNTAESDYGSFPAPAFMIRTVKMDGGTIAMSTRQSGSQGEVTTELHYTTDGEPSINGENVGSAAWYGGKLVIDSGRKIQDILITSREIWNLSADGQKLIIDAEISIPEQGDYKIKQVFVKAPAL